MKRINIITGALLVYLVMMSVFGWPGKKPDPDYLQYFLVLGVSLVTIIVLRFLQIHRHKMREKLKNDKK
jgi:hypothetical protein